MSEFGFTSERIVRFEKIVARYEEPASALLPVLYLAQEQFGFISDKVADYVAKLLNLPASHVYGVLSFYTLFKKKEMGKWVLQVCINITCTMMGSEKLIEVAKQELGISMGQTTHDQKFSLVPVQCLGACDKACVVQANDTYVENLDPEKFRTLLRGLMTDDSHALREVEI